MLRIKNEMEFNKIIEECEIPVNDYYFIMDDKNNQFYIFPKNLNSKQKVEKLLKQYENIHIRKIIKSVKPSKKSRI